MRGRRGEGERRGENVREERRWKRQRKEIKGGWGGRGKGRRKEMRESETGEH